MIQYFRHEQIDKRKWDVCINESPNGIVYALSWYLNIVAGEWDGLIEDDYVSVFPVFPGKKFGIRYSVQPAWAQQLGLFSTQLITAEKSLQFINQAVKHFGWFEMNLNSFQQLPADIHQFKLKENNNYLLSLIYTYEQIASGYSENLRRNLKKNRAGLNVIPSVSHEELVSMFRSGRGKNIHVLKDYCYQSLIRLIYHARSIGIANIYGVTDETNTLLGGAVFLSIKNRSVLIFSAISEEGRNRSAMHILIDDYISQNCSKEIILDFEGSNDENLARFYKSFGAQNSPYFTVTKNRLPLPTGLIMSLRSILR